jgi:hypothetical protein
MITRHSCECADLKGAKIDSKACRWYYGHVATTSRVLSGAPVFMIFGDACAGPFPTWMFWTRPARATLLPENLAYAPTAGMPVDVPLICACAGIWMSPGGFKDAVGR